MKRPLVLALAACALATACGPTTHLDLRLRGVEITSVRVLTPAITLVPPATTPPPASLPPVPPITTYLPPSPAPGASAPPAVLTPPPACPTAGQFDAPEFAAPAAVKGIPANAEYVQKALGTYAENGTQKPLDGIVDVKVVRLPDSTTTANQAVRSWRVERHNGKASSVEVYQLVGPSSLASAASPVSPGIYLVGLAWDDPTRGKLTFQPTGNGLWILPDPVAEATNDTQYVGTATDPNTVTTLELLRNVRAHKRVDACGKLIDTFTVEMSGTLVSPTDQYQVSWTQQLATAYGGLDVASTFSLVSPLTTFRWSRSLTSTTVPKASS